MIPRISEDFLACFYDNYQPLAIETFNDNKGLQKPEFGQLLGYENFTDLRRNFDINSNLEQIPNKNISSEQLEVLNKAFDIAKFCAKDSVTISTIVDILLKADVITQDDYHFYKENGLSDEIPEAFSNAIVKCFNLSRSTVMLKQEEALYLFEKKAEHISFIERLQLLSEFELNQVLSDEAFRSLFKEIQERLQSGHLTLTGRFTGISTETFKMMIREAVEKSFITIIDAIEIINNNFGKRVLGDLESEEEKIIQAIKFLEDRDNKNAQGRIKALNFYTDYCLNKKRPSEEVDRGSYWAYKRREDERFIEIIENTTTITPYVLASYLIDYYSKEDFSSERFAACLYAISKEKTLSKFVDLMSPLIGFQIPGKYSSEDLEHEIKAATILNATVDEIYTHGNSLSKVPDELISRYLKLVNDLYVAKQYDLLTTQVFLIHLIGKGLNSNSKYVEIIRMSLEMASDAFIELLPQYALDSLFGYGCINDFDVSRIEDKVSEDVLKYRASLQSKRLNIALGGFSKERDQDQSKLFDYFSRSGFAEEANDNSHPSVSKTSLNELSTITTLSNADISTEIKQSEIASSINTNFKRSKGGIKVDRENLATGANNIIKRMHRNNKAAKNSDFVISKRGICAFWFFIQKNFNLAKQFKLLGSQAYVIDEDHLYIWNFSEFIADFNSVITKEKPKTITFIDGELQFISCVDSKESLQTKVVFNNLTIKDIKPESISDNKKATELKDKVKILKGNYIKPLKYMLQMKTPLFFYSGVRFNCYGTKYRISEAEK